MKYLSPLAFSFKQQHTDSQHNSITMAAFNGDLWEVTKDQQTRPLEYGSEFRDLSVIVKKFKCHEDKEVIVDTIQKGSQYYPLPTEEATRKSDLEAMLFRGNHKSEKAKPNASLM